MCSQESKQRNVGNLVLVSVGGLLSVFAATKKSKFSAVEEEAVVFFYISFLWNLSK